MASRSDLRFALLLLAGAAPLPAELEWRERLVRLDPAVGVFHARAEFSCVNRGSAPVRVVEVRSGCGCTVTGMDREVIQPGETARLQAVFEAGERRGLQAVTITVLTAGPAAVRHELTLEVALKDVVSASPRALVWRLGDDPAAKNLQIMPAAGFEFVGAASLSPEFAVEVVGRMPGSVQLRVTPRDTWAKRDGAIRLQVTAGTARPIDTLFPLHVK